MESFLNFFFPKYFSAIFLAITLLRKQFVRVRFLENSVHFLSPWLLLPTLITGSPDVVRQYMDKMGQNGMSRRK